MVKNMGRLVLMSALLSLVTGCGLDKTLPSGHFCNLEYIEGDESGYESNEIDYINAKHCPPNYKCILKETITSNQSPEEHYYCALDCPEGFVADKNYDADKNKFESECMRCPSNTYYYNNECVQNTKDHCGSYKTHCDNDYGICDNGICKCAGDREICSDNKCHDLKNENNHCGSCDNPCSIENANNTCINGSCEFQCYDNFIKKDGYCEEKRCNEGEKKCSDDATHIMVCKDNQMINDNGCNPDPGLVDVKSKCITENQIAKCDIYCDAGTTLCPGEGCFDFNTDPRHCGGCEPCPEVANGSYKCTQGKCILECNDDYQKSSDEKSCEDVICTKGDKRCGEMDGVLALQECKGSKWAIIEKCETQKEHAHPTCDKETNPPCGYSCINGFENCNGICINPLTDTNNCGACGTKCKEGDLCCNGTCIDIKTDAKNCGACGTPCGTGETCYGGKCYNYSIDNNNCGKYGNKCNTSLACCNAACVNNQDDENHCGKCGNACASGQTCCSGACKNTNTDLNNCGGCGKKCAKTGCDKGNCICKLNATATVTDNEVTFRQTVNGNVYGWCFKNSKVTILNYSINSTNCSSGIWYKVKVSFSGDYGCNYNDYFNPSGIKEGWMCGNYITCK